MAAPRGKGGCATGSKTGAGTASGTARGVDGGRGAGCLRGGAAHPGGQSCALAGQRSESGTGTASTGGKLGRIKAEFYFDVSGHLFLAKSLRQNARERNLIITTAQLLDLQRLGHDGQRLIARKRVDHHAAVFLRQQGLQARRVAVYRVRFSLIVASPPKKRVTPASSRKSRTAIGASMQN